MVHSQIVFKNSLTLQAKWRLSSLLFHCLIMAVSNLTGTGAEEKQISSIATVNALYDIWDTTSSSL